MKIGIISAMQEEIQALLNHLENPRSEEKGMRTYYSGMLFGNDVVLVFSRWGKVASAVTTTQLINDYHVDEIIFTGVAGAISSKLNIGDIVVGRNLMQHDMNAYPLYPKYEIPLLGKGSFQTKDTERLLHASKEFIADFNQYISANEAEEFHISKPKVVVGDIVSGDRFVSDLNKIKKLRVEFPGAKCVEMEGAAVAQVCYEYDIPFSIIRVISDEANHSATIDFPKFCQSVAQKYIKGIFENYFSLILL
ncbi:5'-methylthioadenosine/adenosylhomocysteine nucleosidase [Aureivirga sp. CE67]|uniref:5'-methylthioadenosine/adenosylhomocysteine nucleosidase n=1 Tax=Aureivirga sp. CE67 TaxID=1788983 RepID=UPI0018C90D4A|nr:5'-methylthioadenosine/adenosylhomocysteine nucleosidase [Aureivirga sp. CE67]